MPRIAPNCLAEFAGGLSGHPPAARLGKHHAMAVGRDDDPALLDREAEYNQRPHAAGRSYRCRTTRFVSDRPDGVRSLCRACAPWPAPARVRLLAVMLDHTRGNAAFRSPPVGNKTPSRALAGNAAASVVRATPTARNTVLPVIITYSAYECAVAAPSIRPPLDASSCVEVGGIFSTSGTDGNGLVARHEDSIAALHRR